MAKNILLEPESELRRREAPPNYPYIFRRVFLCGHPEEFIEVSRPQSCERLMHTFVSQDDYNRYIRARKGKLTYTDERCRLCATEHYEQHQKPQRHSVKTADIRSKIASQDGVVCLQQVTSGVTDGLGLALTQLQRGDGVKHQTILRTRAPEFEPEKDWQLIERSYSSDNGKALRYIGQPDEAVWRPRNSQPTESYLCLDKDGSESFSDSEETGMVQKDCQRKGIRINHLKDYTHNPDIDAQALVPFTERQKASSTRSSHGIKSQAVEEAYQFENEHCANQDVCISRFSPCSSDQSDNDSGNKTRVRWKLGKLKEDFQAQSKSSGTLISLREPLRLWKKLSKDAPTWFEEKQRRSSNIRNLQPDLSKRSKQDVLEPIKSTGPVCRRSYLQGAEESLKEGEDTKTAEMRWSGHIVHAMRSFESSTNVSAVLNNTGHSARVRRVETEGTSPNRASLSRSTADTTKPCPGLGAVSTTSNYIRYACELLPNGTARSSSSSEGRVSTPTHSGDRRSCRTNAAKSVDPRGSLSLLTLNKRLPPLPIAQCPPWEQKHVGIAV